MKYVELFYIKNNIQKYKMVHLQLLWHLLQRFYYQIQVQLHIVKT